MVTIKYISDTVVNVYLYGVIHTKALGNFRSMIRDAETVTVTYLNYKTITVNYDAMMRSLMMNAHRS